MKRYIITLFLIIAVLPVAAQTDKNLESKVNKLLKENENLNHRLDVLEKKIDDITWFHRVGDFAFIDKVYIYGPPPANVKNPEQTGATNPVKFWSYVFIPKDIDPNKKYPLLVFPHGGVHGDFSTYYTHIVKEMLAQGYIVVAPEYRGSTGYGSGHWHKIDYGGLENEDVYASRNYMVENYDFVDGNRVGIVGWSHGGMIALHNIFDHPDSYTCAFAGVPVSDMILRYGYATDDYRKLYDADYHIGKTPRENINEYRRRSPAWQAHKLKTPLLIHTNTNDDDVYVIEVEALIKSLKAEGKRFEYEIFQDMPGGHSFDRIDTKAARQIRVKIYKFLAQYLNPPKPIKTVEDINRAAYLPMK
ncbi:MAG TPA: S9 family peptidase [Bacteroidales bacterium]|nr:S9 family peptidase [Bacteroidales bacterium]